MKAPQLFQHRCALALACAWILVPSGFERAGAADFLDPNADLDALPSVPAGFEVSFFAREPMVRQPCSLAFDARGRLCVGMGPQYRNPRPETPGDSVVLILDTDGDGRADTSRVFATGFNAIQGMAWRGQDLWVANAPDLTRVRDLDGDDVADEYVRVYTDLGNLEHGLHGLNWGPDGRLYMSKGNSKGLSQPGRYAPRAFRELWGVQAPAGTQDFPPPVRFGKGEYQKAYHDPEDDWGREGGVLRCDADGSNLEIVARGFRNPWDITFDTGFHWIGTDNDQTTGDRVFMPFSGAHFGWNHPWSAHWSDAPHAPSAPVSGPLFEGSGTGVIHVGATGFPDSYTGAFLVNDWLLKATYLWRPRWDGPLMRPDGTWSVFIQGGKSLYRPTDLEFGPDGALWVLGWSRGYGAEYKDGGFSSEGRVFRVVWKGTPARPHRTYSLDLPMKERPIEELIASFDAPVSTWRINAQDELVRRNSAARDALVREFEYPSSQGRETWCAWTLGRFPASDHSIDALMASVVTNASRSLNARIQALRVLGFRGRAQPGKRELPPAIASSLGDSEVRIRFEAVLSMRECGRTDRLTALWDLAANESDPTTYYATWQTLRFLTDPSQLRAALQDPRAGVRRAALLALMEDHRLTIAEVRLIDKDPSSAVRDVAAAWLRKAEAGGESVQVRGRPLNVQTEGAAVEKASGPAVARHVRAKSSGVYRIVPGGFRVGAAVYSDRGYTLKQVPDAWNGLDYIQTPNNDDGCQGDDWLTFEALRPVRVRVAFDARSSHVPSWLRRNFTPESQPVRGDHWSFDVYAREFPAGTISLGGNTDDGKAGGKGHYLVVLEPIARATGGVPTRLEDVLALMDKADSQRGAWLFLHPRGAGCVQCHRLDGRGNAFAPDLSALGDRATPRHLVESILQPNAVITEGFHLQTIETDGEEISGILIEESGLSVTLGMATGQRRVIPKAGVRARRTGPGSGMPAFDVALEASEVADLVAYLLPAKSESGPSPRGAREPKGLGFEKREDRLKVLMDGLVAAEFVFQDNKILRPFFANVHVANGAKVTRNHPPVPGQDAVDHDTMHPGVWLAFGDISGVDFWRNKGRMVHVRFVEEPRVREGILRFATESRLENVAGERLCMLTQHFEIEALKDSWLLIWDAAFQSPDRDLTFGDQEEMGFGARVATGITEKSGGRIRNSAGFETAAATWGQGAAWCDYSGSLDGAEAGITLMSAPSNFRGSWWHNRDYGVFVANPFGRASMKQGAPSAVVVRQGETLRLRFGATFHTGKDYSPSDAYQAFLQRKSVSRP